MGWLQYHKLGGLCQLDSKHCGAIACEVLQILLEVDNVPASSLTTFGSRKRPYRHVWFVVCDRGDCAQARPTIFVALCQQGALGTQEKCVRNLTGSSHSAHKL